MCVGQGLQDLTTEALAKGFQITEKNPMLGVESRANLLRSLGKSLLSHPEVFGQEGRPGNVVGKHNPLSFMAFIFPFPGILTNFTIQIS